MLTIHNARYVFGCTILFVHFLGICVFLWRAAYQIADPATFQSVALGALALMPLTAIYAITFFRFVVANPHVPLAERKEKIDLAPFAVQYSVIIIFSVVLVGGIWYLFDTEYLIGGYENIQTFVSFVEAVFASFLGLIFSKLFPMQWEGGTPANPVPAKAGDHRGDADALASFLAEAGLAAKDATELASIISAEGPESEREPLGPRGQEWLGSNLSKAADGTWSLGAAAAMRVAREAAARFYGLA